jgi:hypothetical protein
MAPSPEIALLPPALPAATSDQTTLPGAYHASERPASARPPAASACYAATPEVGVGRPHAAPWTMTNHTPAA